MSDGLGPRELRLSALLYILRSTLHSDTRKTARDQTEYYAILPQARLWTLGGTVQYRGRDRGWLGARDSRYQGVCTLETTLVSLEVSSVVTMA